MRVRLYHVDGTLLHTIDAEVYPMVATPDEPAHHQWRAIQRRQCLECRHQEPREHLPGAHRARHAVAVMPDGQRILSGGYDNTVRVWRLNGTLRTPSRCTPLPR